MVNDAPIEQVRVAAYEVPTEEPESDGTLAWDSVTIVVVEAAAGGENGIGYTYADQSAATLVASKLADVVEGRDAFAIPSTWWAMVHAIRNLGWPGIARPRSARSISRSGTSKRSCSASALRISSAARTPRFPSTVRAA